MLLAEQSAFNPLGDDLLAWLLLAFGAALVFGNVAALLRPPANRPAPRPEGSDAGGEAALDRAPLARTVLMIGVGVVAGGWALASLIGG